MNRIIKTSAIMGEIIDDASKRFEPSYVLSKNNKEIMLKCCEVIDAFCEEVDAKSATIFVDDTTKMIMLSIISDNFEINNKVGSNFFWIVSRCDSYSFEPNSDETFCIQFVFPSIWVNIE